MDSKTIALFVTVVASGLCLATEAVSETWSVYRDTIYDCRLDYPSSVFTADPIDMAEKAQRFSGPENSIYFRIMGADNADDLSPAEIKAKYLSADVPGELTYERTKSRFLVLSGYRGDAIFYTRVAVSADERTLCILEVTYPKRVKKAFDAIVTRMSRSFSVNRRP